MRKLIIFLPVLCLFLVFQNGIQAQCDFDPTISFLPPDDDGIYCPGGSIILSTQNSDSYQWFYNFTDSNTGGTPLDFGSSSWIELDPGEWAVTYIYVESTIDGCTEASPTVVWDAWVFNNPAISHPPVMDYCAGEEVTISNAFPGPTMFQWYNNGEPIDGATDAEYIVTESGTYVLEATYPECPFSYLTSGIGPTFTFNEAEVPNISQIGNTLESTSAQSYLWIMNGLATTEFDQTFIPFENGEYVVLIEDENGCEAFSDPYDFVFTGLEEIQEKNLSLFPNPSSDVFNIQYEGDMIGMVSIIDAVGKMVARSYHVTDQAAIDVSKLTPGMYTILLNDHLVTQKLSVK